jgi:hypothetical protein
VKGKLVVALLLACAVGVAVAGAADAKTPAKKKPAKAKFDMRFDCARVAPASVVTSLAAGFGGTYALKPTKDDSFNAGTGGFSHCDYAQSAGFPWSAKAEGPGEVTILYGPGAVSFFKRDHTAAEEGVKCTGMKAQGETPDPRQCGPVPVAGIGTQAYEAASYIAVLRGKVFVQVDLASVPDANGQPVLVSADVLESFAKGLLARLPAE